MVVFAFELWYNNSGGDNVAISERIKAAREKAGMTQAELGEKVGISGVAIMRYEKGQRQPRFDQLEKIASTLDVSLAYLLGRDSDLLSPALQHAFFDAFLKRVEEKLLGADPSDLEEQFGTSQPYKDVFESRDTLTLDKVKDMSDELGVPLEYLISGENDPADHYPLGDQELEAGIALAEARLIETVHRICGMSKNGTYYDKKAWNPAKIDKIREYIKDSQAILQKLIASDTDKK